MLRKYPPVGSKPGVILESEDSYSTQLTIFSYSPSSLEEDEFTIENYVNYQDENETENPLNRIKSVLNSSNIIWLNICGLNDTNLLLEISKIFNLHELTTADIANVPQRPKIEEQEDYVFIISTMLYYQKDYSLDREQISIILGNKFVLTFQEKSGDVLEPVRKRLRTTSNSMRKLGSDYLAYAILDTVIDSYFPVIENMGEFLEEIESEITQNKSKNILKEISSIKRQLMTIRRTIWPHREIFNSILRSDFSLIKKNTKLYFRDSYDHTVELIDVVEMFREMSGNFIDIHLSSISNKLNDVMKVLTIISTVFIPLSFIASIYGMNFEYMPELKYQLAYPLVLLFMFTAASIMLFIFWKRGWIGKGSNA